MARHCPDCGDPLTQHGVCGSCGYGKKSGKDKAFDPDWWRCSNTDRGFRCAAAGSIMHGTHGGGPWYCVTHAYPSSFAKLTAPRGVFRSMRSALGVVDEEYLLERAAIEDDGVLPL